METMTDTPNTSEALATIFERDGELSEENAPEVLVKLCRAMERERDEARKERDEARAALETGGLLGILDRAGHDRAAAIRERDDARKAAEHYRNLYYLPKDGLSAAKNHPFSWENQTKP